MTGQPLPTSVRGCARCGGDHAVEYREFRRPIPDVDGAFTHWGACTVTGDPILLRFHAVPAVQEQMKGRVIVAGQRYTGKDWEPLTVEEIAELVRRPHEPRQWDAVYVYLADLEPETEASA